MEFSQITWGEKMKLEDTDRGEMIIIMQWVLKKQGRGSRLDSYGLGYGAGKKRKLCVV